MNAHKKNSLLLSILFVVLMMVSCSTSKEANNYKNNIDGKWRLQTVVTEGIIGKVKSQILNETDVNCFYRIITKWYGETPPIVDNTTTENRSFNLSIEFVITANEKMKAEAKAEADPKQ